jgi:hypothetical protein
MLQNHLGQDILHNLKNEFSIKMIIVQGGVKRGLSDAQPSLLKKKKGEDAIGILSPSLHDYHY